MAPHDAFWFQVMQITQGEDEEEEITQSFRENSSAADRNKEVCMIRLRPSDPLSIHTFAGKGTMEIFLLASL